MDLPGLITVAPDQTGLLDELADMVGTCFREEMWFATLLDALDLDEEQRLAVTRAAMRADFHNTAPYGCVYTLPDHAAAANAFLRSDLGGIEWAELEARAAFDLSGVLTGQKEDALLQRAEAMGPVSDTDWPSRMAGDEDFIYFISVGVDPARRGSGAFGRLFRPFLDFADGRGITSYLDCYTDRLEQVYGHYGFETVLRLNAPGFDLTERCMVRRPKRPGRPQQQPAG